MSPMSPMSPKVVSPMSPMSPEHVSAPYLFKKDKRHWRQWRHVIPSYIKHLVKNKHPQIQWHTARFNRVLTKYGAEHSSKLALWFTCGVYFGVLAMFGSIFILLYTFISGQQGAYFCLLE